MTVANLSQHCLLALLLAVEPYPLDPDEAPVHRELLLRWLRTARVNLFADDQDERSMRVISADRLIQMLQPGPGTMRPAEPMTVKIDRSGSSGDVVRLVLKNAVVLDQAAPDVAYDVEILLKPLAQYRNEQRRFAASAGGEQRRASESGASHTTPIVAPKRTLYERLRRTRSHMEVGAHQTAPKSK